MQTLAIEKLTPTYLRKLDRQTYLATAIAILIVTLSLLWMLLHIGGSATVGLFADIVYAVAAFIGATWTSITAYRTRYGPLPLTPRHQLAWLLISLGIFADALGGIYFAYLEHYLGQANPVPSVSDIGFTLFYLFIFPGLLLMPTRQKSARFPLPVILDACITTLCILGVSWFLFIGPTFILQRDAHASTATLITVLSYPFWDILLILAIVLLFWRRFELALSPPSLILRITALLSFTWADTSYAYYSALGTYNSGTFYIDPFWLIGTLLLGLSALYQYRTLAHRSYNESTHPAHTPESPITALSKDLQPTELLQPIRDTTHHRPFTIRQSFLIYIPLSFLLGFALYSEFTQHNAISLFLIVLGALVGVLVTIRYILATQQNEILLQEREQQREEAERLRLRLLAAQLNEILELDPLLECIVTLATSELGFDAAMLLLIEDYEQAQHKPCNVLVRVAATGSSATNAWRLQGVRLPRTLILSGKAMEVLWTQQDTHPLLPAEVHTCPQHQHIQATLFIPLRYQGKVQGTIGFSSRANQHFSRHDIHIAEAFAEQAAIACTNARLYQQVRDAHQRQKELDQLKDMFLTTTSHELRTPLTAVQGYLELVTQYGEDFSPHERQEFLQKAQHCCDELVAVLGHITEASDLETHMDKHSIHLEQVSVQEIIHSIMDLIEPSIRQEQREIYLDIPASFYVRADPARLRQVLLNLSVNALKYSPAGTPIAFLAHALADRIVISVADKGQGIPPQDHVHLFQRFVRLERDINSPVRGSGLGLYISRRLIEAMDGKIEVESSGIEGAGSTFHIQLPACNSLTKSQPTYQPPQIQPYPPEKPSSHAPAYAQCAPVASYPHTDCIDADSINPQPAAPPDAQDQPAQDQHQHPLPSTPS